jgi:hypothetical protein
MGRTRQHWTAEDGTPARATRRQRVGTGLAPHSRGHEHLVFDAPPRQPRRASGAEALPHVSEKKEKWALGDRANVTVLRFVSDENGGGTPTWIDEPATVIDVIGDRVVIMLADQDSTSVKRSAWSEDLRSAHKVLQPRGLQLLEEAYGQDVKGTSGNGQFVVVLLVDAPSLAVVSEHPVGQVGIFRFPNSVPEVRLPMEDIFHEVAHLWQADYAFRTRTGNDYPRSPLWAYEGGAMVLETMMLQMAGGHDHTRPRNLESYYGRGSIFGWVENPFTESATWVYSMPYGYTTSQVIMDDFVWRLLRRGVPFATAIREVLSGTMDGWYGHALKRPDRGMVNRMRPLLGADWDPTDAILKAVASLGADDRTASAEYQQPWQYQIWSPISVPFMVPAGHIRLGDGVEILQRFDDGFYGYYLVDAAAGGTLRITASIPVEWTLVRTR